MKKILFLITLSVFTLFAMATKPHIDYVRVDVEKSTVKWKGSKISTDSHEGLVQIEKGVLMINHGTLVGGVISIDMTSISNTDMQERRKERLEGHLKSDDFFDVEQFPISTITIIKATKKEGSNYNIVADLTIKGITHSITFDAEVSIRKITFSTKAKIKIDRTKWGIKYKSGNFFKDLGDKAILDEIEFDISLISAT